MSGTEYHKIQSVYKRDDKGVILPGKYSTPEIEYLKDNQWHWTEKVDGSNHAVVIDFNVEDEVGLTYRGRTDRAQIPPFLLHKMKFIFEAPGMGGRILGAFQTDSQWSFDRVILYGEGYGAKIQKGGGNYMRDGVDFVLFDVRVGDWWLQRKDVEDVAGKLGLRVVPYVLTGTIAEAEDLVKSGFKSGWPGVRVPEGLVGKPVVPMFDRRGRRVVTKIKHKDIWDFAAKRAKDHSWLNEAITVNIEGQPNRGFDPGAGFNPGYFLPPQRMAHGWID